MSQKTMSGEGVGWAELLSPIPDVEKHPLFEQNDPWQPWGTRIQSFHVWGLTPGLPIFPRQVTSPGVCGRRPRLLGDTGDFQSVSQVTAALRQKDPGEGTRLHRPALPFLMSRGPWADRLACLSPKFTAVPAALPALGPGSHLGNRSWRVTRSTEACPGTSVSPS